MRSFLFILQIVLLVFAAETTASEQYPYSASVAVTETSVRSGPSEEFYPTSQLRLGDKVEVYYETEDWCAIRPPIGSFSWISARYVELGTNNIGSVIADGLASRVGCENTELCDTVQVKLKKGEKVLVLDRYETPENAASPLWFKITPPSGEFRWVSRNALMPDTTVKMASLSPGRTISKRSVVQVAYETETGNTASNTIANTASAKIDPPVSPPMPTRPVRLPPQNDLPETQSVKKVDSFPNISPNDSQNTVKKTLADLPSLSTKLALNQPGTLAVDPVKEPDPFQKAFEELKEETRIALVRPTENWVFDTLIHRGGELYEVAPTDKDLEKVYQLVETLQRTKTVRQEIAMRRQFKTGQLLTPPPSATPQPANYVSAPIISNSGAPAPMNPAAAQPNPKMTTATVKTPISRTANFDIVGKLGAFEPLPKGHPPYALVNEKEEIICLVSPASGVDLKPFLGKTVGINGILGFFEKPGQPNRRHLTAREAVLTE